MPELRTMYSTGSAVVVNIPKIYREIADLGQGVTAQLDLVTPKQLLRDMGVAEAVISQMELSEEHFITVRRHHS